MNSFQPFTAAETESDPSWETFPIALANQQQAKFFFFNVFPPEPYASITSQLAVSCARSRNKQLRARLKGHGRLQRQTQEAPASQAAAGEISVDAAGVNVLSNMAAVIMLKKNKKSD